MPSLANRPPIAGLTLADKHERLRDVIAGHRKLDVAAEIAAAVAGSERIIVAG